jgi:hypothetical protein
LWDGSAYLGHVLKSMDVAFSMSNYNHIVNHLLNKIFFKASRIHWYQGYTPTHCSTQRQALRVAIFLHPPPELTVSSRTRSPVDSPSSCLVPAAMATAAAVHHVRAKHATDDGPGEEIGFGALRRKNHHADQVLIPEGARKHVVRPTPPLQKRASLVSSLTPLVGTCRLSHPRSSCSEHTGNGSMTALVPGFTGEILLTD